MGKRHSQAIRLPAHRVIARTPRDPHFSTTASLSPEVAGYVADCIAQGAPPVLFMSAWVDYGKKQVTLRLASPHEVMNSEHSCLSGLFGEES